MKTYKIGIIGYGGFGQFLHHWWSQLENAEVVAIADHGHHTRQPDCRVYVDWRELVDDPEVDIVSIVTPPSLHAEMACAAMRAGKHVLLEKPAALNPESARQILAVQQETGRAITVDHMIRYNPLIRHFMRLGHSGRLGKLRHVVVNNYAQDAALPPTHWFWDETLSGGILVEHGVHFFDIVNALGGQHAIEVCGASANRNPDQRDRVAAMVKYDGGLIANYYHAFSGPGLFEQTTIQLAYDLARVTIEGWMPLKGSVKALVNDDILKGLAALPGWTPVQYEPLDAPSDDSRPEGWGTTGETPLARTSVQCGGVPYDVDRIVTATFEIPRSKGEVYGKCVQDIMSDLIRKMEDPAHRLAITLEDAVTAVEIAAQATR